MKIITIVGARPQFIKAAAVSRIFKNNCKIREKIVHTGQHYDANMSGIFFTELGIPTPSYNLNIGSGSHGTQTGRMLQYIEDVLLREAPDSVLVYGDTNSTLAGALAAVKLHIPVAHVEAGLRSFNRRMPEEINRILTDHIAHWLFCPTATAVSYLKAEGITKAVYNVGDVMYDNFLFFSGIAIHKSSILRDLELMDKGYYLTTVHRPENTEYPQRLRAIFKALAALPKSIILPLHPRTQKVMEKEGIVLGENIKVIEPVSYLDMCILQERASVILTDSGGIQKEAFFCRVPCVTLRDETEWTELVECGWNRVVGADEAKIMDAVETFENSPPATAEELYGDGTAAEQIAELIISRA